MPERGHFVWDSRGGVWGRVFRVWGKEQLLDHDSGRGSESGRLSKSSHLFKGR